MFIHPSAFGRGPVEDVTKKPLSRRPEDRNRGSGGTRQGPGQHRHAAAPQEQRRPIRHLPDHPVSGGHHAQGCQPPGTDANTFGEEGKITFTGCHYTGGNDLVALAGPAAENFYWTTSYIVTSEPGPGTDFQLELAKKYGRDEKTANSHNYINGAMVAQVATECILRAKTKGAESHQRKPVCRNAGHER
jgi:branched-chain amino acid transport system substrate-binding protein